MLIIPIGRGLAANLAAVILLGAAIALVRTSEDHSLLVLVSLIALAAGLCPARAGIRIIERRDEWSRTRMDGARGRLRAEAGGDPDPHRRGGRGELGSPR